MIEIKSVLHPTDFSEPSKLALDYAYALAEKFSAELHLMHVIPDTIVFMPYEEEAYLPPNFYRSTRECAEKQLAKLPQKGEALPKPVLRAIKQGNTVIEILTYSEENNIDLIVMGTHGHTGFQHLIIGSVAENVVRKSSCPVLTVR